MTEKTGIKWIDSDGIEKEIKIDKYRAIYPYEHMVTKVWAMTTAKGKKHPEYKRIKAELGDDWDTDITDNWWDIGVLPEYERLVLSTILRGGN